MKDGVGGYFLQRGEQMWNQSELWLPRVWGYGWSMGIGNLGALLTHPQGCCKAEMICTEALCSQEMAMHRW